MKIGIFTPTLVDGDAVGNDVIGMGDSLLRNGCIVYLCAKNSKFQGVSNPQLLWDFSEDDIYIYHHSIDCEIGINLLEKLKCRKIVKYHNITPPNFFQEGSDVKRQCEAGIEQLKRILNVNCEIWVDSEFNGQDIHPKPYHILPPYNQASILSRVGADLEAVFPYHDWKTNIVMIGRVVPSKDILSGIRAFARYKQINPYSRLIIIGDAGFSSYVFEIQALAKSLGVYDSLIITSKITINQLKAFYLIADVLLVTSLHEGFCVPIVEAMACKIPVVAKKNAAIPYTGEDSIAYGDSEETLANAIDLVTKERYYYMNKGYQRYKEHFQNSVVEQKFLKCLNLEKPR